MRLRECAERLLHKAEQDAFVVRKLEEDPASPDEIIGFHAQQAVEKCLKAVLTCHGISYHRTHDIKRLMNLVCQHELGFLEELEDIRRLSPFAVEFRYDDLPSEPEPPFDRAWAVMRVSQTCAWATGIVRARQ